MSYPKKNGPVVENSGKSQNTLLEGPDHKSTCFSAQDSVFQLISLESLITTFQCEKAHIIYHAENAEESQMVWQVCYSGYCNVSKWKSELNADGITQGFCFSMFYIY